MTIEDIKKQFSVKETKPTSEDLKRFSMIIPYPYKDNKTYWIYFKTLDEYTLFEYLEGKKDYKSKEKLFGITDEQKEVIISHTENDTRKVKYIQKKLPNKCVIQDGKIRRELDVWITNIDTENKTLLHTLTVKSRGKG